MKKFIKCLLIPLVTVVIVAILMFTGCVQRAPAPAPELLGFGPMKGVGVKPDGTPYRFESALPFRGFDFMVCLDEVTHSLVNRAGAEINTSDAAGDIGKQCAAFEDAIIKKPDAILTSAIEEEAIGPFIASATAAGIPVFDYDHCTFHEDIVCGVGSDSLQEGETQAQFYVDYVEETGEHLYVYGVWGVRGNEIDEGRFQGYHNLFDPHPLIDMIESPNTGFQSEQAMNWVLDAFPANPELNACITPYDMDFGICEALRMMDRLYPAGDPNHVLINVMIAEPQTLDNIRAGYVDCLVTHSPWEIADLGARVMLTSVCLGRPIPEHIYLVPSLITIAEVDNPPHGAPLLWGDMMRAEPDYDLWPILEFPEYIETPTVTMKMPGY